MKALKKCAPEDAKAPLTQMMGGHDEPLALTDFVWEQSMVDKNVSPLGRTGLQVCFWQNASARATGMASLARALRYAADELNLYAEKG